MLHRHYHSIISEISKHDHYGRPLFPHHAPKVVHSACHWPLSGDVGTAFVVTLKKEIRTRPGQSLTHCDFKVQTRLKNLLENCVCKMFSRKKVRVSNFLREGTGLAAPLSSPLPLPSISAIFAKRPQAPIFTPRGKKGSYLAQDQTAKQ